MFTMTKSVYFIRHGQCEANAKGIIAGSEDDSALTKLGEEQAKSLAIKLRGTKFDLVVATPLERAQDTAKIVCEEIGLNSDIVINKDFTERGVGEFVGRPLEEFFAYVQSGGKAGETDQEMYDRVKAGIEWLKSQDFKNALVVTHNGTLKMIRIVLEGLKPSDFYVMPKTENGEYLKVEM